MDEKAKDTYAKKKVEEITHYKNTCSKKTEEIFKCDDGLLKLGGWVTIKSVHEQDGKKTRLGVYVGKISTALTMAFREDAKKKGVMKGKEGMGENEIVELFGNPVFYVPKLGKCLAGFESWWRAIPREDYQKSCEDMKEGSEFTWEEIEAYCQSLLLREN